jgi:iron complex transport system substrate-binding protein
MKLNRQRWAKIFAMTAMVSLSACVKQSDTPQVDQTQKLDAPLSIKHALGNTVIDYIPKHVAVLDMNELDFLDQLNVSVAGIPKDFIPHFLKKYAEDENIKDLGSIVQPNMEFIHALKPDLILMTPIQSTHYKELSEIAPTVHYDINFKNSEKNHLVEIKNHLLSLGKIFKKEDLAQEKVTGLDQQISEIKQLTKDRPEKALIVLHNNGAFSNFGTQSRYGFVFNDFGVKPSSVVVDNSLHGQPISSEFIKNADPDILYIVDRTAVMEHRPVINAEQVSNPLLRSTKAWKNGRVVFVDADAWYTTGASPTSISIIMKDVQKGYQP